jgi:hypothetical protein
MAVLVNNTNNFNARAVPILGFSHWMPIVPILAFFAESRRLIAASFPP